MNNSEKSNKIIAIHDQFWQGLADRDTELRFSVCADDITFIGTGLHERAENKDAYRKINQQGIEHFPDPYKIDFLWKQLTVFENVAWVECEVIWSKEIDGFVSKELIRNTTVLKYENNTWWVTHVHGSTPDYRLQDGDFETNAKNIIRNNELEKQVFERTAELNKALQNLKATQSQLIQSEKMASLGELTAGIAHEIQNPLNFVNNFSEVNKELVDELQQELKAGKIDNAIEISNDIKANEEKINHHGKRADAIVKGMLQHSRSSSGVKEPTDINALCDEYLRLSYHGLRAKDKDFNATMKTDFDTSIGNINIIPQDIGRVVLNLLTNAFYAVNERKKQEGDDYEPIVTIVTKATKNPLSGGRGAEINVTDNGNGIPQKIVDKIFQPFFTTKPTGQGTGLGLSLSYDIVKAHGGEIKVETKQDAGTTFIIQLPTN